MEIDSSNKKKDDTTYSRVIFYIKNKKSLN